MSFCMMLNNFDPQCNDVIDKTMPKDVVLIMLIMFQGAFT